MNKLSKKEITKFQKKILDWYALNKRELPWRDVPVGTSLDQKAYRILVSEIMLQQTQVSRVIPKYEAWLQAFPTVRDLAKAKTSDVLRLWSGLGYNRRALYLQKCAKALNELRIKNYELRIEKDTYWPQTIEELKKLPGIGEYTAAAVACFAFDAQVAVVDTNIRKVILTQFFYKSEIRNKKSETNTNDKNKKFKTVSNLNNSNFDIVSSFDIRASNLSGLQFQAIADQMLPKGKASEWNQSLMDYASVVLKKEKIPLVKQSKFKDSNRYYRGQIIKMLIEKKEVKVKELIEHFQKEEIFVKTIIQGLVKDGMIKETQGLLVIDSGSTSNVAEASLE